MSKSKVAPSEQLSMVIDPHRYLSHFGAEGRACPERPPRPKSPKRSGGLPGARQRTTPAWIKCLAARWASRPNSSAPFTSSPPPDSHSRSRPSRLFRAPPRSGALPLYRLNQVEAVRSIPSWPRSDQIRWAWGFGGFPGSFDLPSWIASV